MTVPFPGGYSWHSCHGRLFLSLVQLTFLSYRFRSLCDTLEMFSALSKLLMGLTPDPESIIPESVMKDLLSIETTPTII